MLILMRMLTDVNLPVDCTDEENIYLRIRVTKNKKAINPTSIHGPAILTTDEQFLFLEISQGSKLALDFKNSQRLGILVIKKTCLFILHYIMWLVFVCVIFL